MFASVRTRHIRGGSGCCHKNSIQKQTIVAAAQRHPCFKLLPLRQYVVTVNVCGWCTAGDRTPAAFSQLLIIQNNQTHIVGPHTRYTRRTTTVAKAVAYIHIIGMPTYVPPFRLATPRGYQINPIPQGNLVLSITTCSSKVRVKKRKRHIIRCLSEAWPVRSPCRRINNPTFQT